MELSANAMRPGAGGPPSVGRPNGRRTPLGGVAAERRRGEAGGANVKAIVWTVVLLMIVYVAAMMLPPLISEYQFQDSLQEIARYASVNRRTSEQVRQAVFAEAQKQDLPVQVDDIKVAGAAGNVHIDVDYSVTVDLKLYQWTLNFHPAASNAALL
jgi:hypothetical protein